jgi:NADP-dependent 3-hydroxy acid dehydrogenase YdfG
VVTGASSGIGEATARSFAARGWTVIGVARRADRLSALAAETGIETIVADLTQQANVDALRDRLAVSGPIHALINVAGGAFGADTVEESSADDWSRMFDLNVVAVKRVVEALLPLLRRGAVDAADGDVPHADILTVTSTAGFVAYESGGGYNAAKFGAHALMGALRLELAGEPIRVLEVAPGMVRTEEFTLNRLGGDTERTESLYAGVEHPLLADDVAAVITGVIELPGHVNVDLTVVRPVAQAAQHKLVRAPLAPKG